MRKPARCCTAPAKLRAAGMSHACVSPAIHPRICLSATCLKADKTCCRGLFLVRRYKRQGGGHNLSVVHKRRKSAPRQGQERAGACTEPGGQQFGGPSTSQLSQGSRAMLPAMQPSALAGLRRNASTPLLQFHSACSQTDDNRDGAYGPKVTRHSGRVTLCYPGLGGRGPSS